MALDFFDDARQALPIVTPLLTRDPVVGTILATAITRAAASHARGVPQRSRHPVWWLVVRDAMGEIVGAGMRSAPFTPHPIYLTTMPDADARALARVLVARGEPVRHANGALPAVTAYAHEHARLRGGTVRVADHTRLFELGELRDPRPVPGDLRAAEESDIPLVLQWFETFTADAAEQSGTAVTQGGIPPEDVAAKVRGGLVWLWVDDDRPVCLVARSESTFGVTRIGPVYTPRAQRGHGFGSAATAAVSRRIRDAGDRVCLFTNQANPVSNRIYQRLGYQPVVDMANLVVDPSAHHSPG